jgi:hypothetical protein
VGRSLWRENGAVVYNCCWPAPTQSFSGPSPVELMTIFYCPRFENSLFVASYDSQGYGGNIRPRLHTRLSQFPFPILLYPLSTDHSQKTVPLLFQCADHTENTCHLSDCDLSQKSKSHCDWRSVSQWVSLGVEPHLGLMTRYLLLFDSYGLVFFCGAPSLTRGRVYLLSESLRALVSHLL